MRTIGRRWPTKKANGVKTATGDICGVLFRSNQLVRKPGGAYACSGSGTNDDARGRDAFELDQLNAADAQLHRSVPTAMGGNSDNDL